MSSGVLNQTELDTLLIAGLSLDRGKCLIGIKLKPLMSEVQTRKY